MLAPKPEAGSGIIDSVPYCVVGFPCVCVDMMGAGGCPLHFTVSPE